MAVQYNEQTRQYERDGVVITAAALRLLIDRLSDETRRELRKLAGRRERGIITTEQFAEGMATILTASLIVAASVGRGGRARVTDWSKVEAKLNWQKQYIDGFARKIAAGALATSAGAIAARAASYASTVYPMFANERFDERKEADKEMLCRLIQHSKEGCGECIADSDDGWMPVSEMGELGTRECGDWCLCTIEFEDEI